MFDWNFSIAQVLDIGIATSEASSGYIMAFGICDACVASYENTITKFNLNILSTVVS